MIAPSSYHDMRGSCSSAVLWCQQWTWGVIVGCWQDSPSGRRSQRWRGNSSTQRQPRTVSTVPPTQTFPPRRHPATSEAPIDYRLAGSSCAAVSSPMALGVRAISVREGSREKRKKKLVPHPIRARQERGEPRMRSLLPRAPLRRSPTAECTCGRQYSITHKLTLVVLGSP